MNTFIQEANLDCGFIDAVCFLAFTHFVQCYSRLVVSLLGFLLGFLFGWLVAERVRIGFFLGESKLFHIINTAVRKCAVMDTYISYNKRETAFLGVMIDTFDRPLYVQSLLQLM